MSFTEVLNHFARRGPLLRSAVVTWVPKAKDHAAIAVGEPGSDLFQQGLLLDQQRLDQSWGLTDCVSFCIINQQCMAEALASDKHFEQAGFAALLRN